MPRVSSQRRASIRRTRSGIKSGDQISNVNTLIRQIDRKISCYYRDMLLSVTPAADTWLRINGFAEAINICPLTICNNL